MLRASLICIGLLCTSSAFNFSPGWTGFRRLVLAPLIVVSGLSLCPIDSFASGTLSEQLAAMQAAQNALDAQDVEWSVVPGMEKEGVIYRDYREGRGGGDQVRVQDSKITAEMVVRIKKLSTQKDPGGVRYYSTKLDAPPNGEVQWTTGQGAYLPALENGMVNMKKGGLRRIEVPSTLVFKAQKLGQLPIPAPSDEDGTRRYSKLLKSDATLIFEVLVKSVTNQQPAE